MPQISNRGQLMPPSPIRKLVPFAEQAKRNGIKVIHLNIGQPDIETPEVALKAVKNIQLKVIEYSHSAGNLSYRKKLSTYYEKHGIHVSENNILITTGGSEALLFTFFSCLNEGDEIIVPEPFYANYNGFAVTAGVKIIPVTSSIKDGFKLPPIEEFEKLINSKTKAILICNPGNPTGYLYTREEIEKLGKIVKKHNLFLFADEVYREFTYDGKKHFSIMCLEGLEDHLVMIDSISKRYSMCGARIGALVTKNPQVYDAALKFAQARLSPPTFGQIAGEAALDTPSSYFNNVIEEYIQRRNVLVEGLNSIEGVYCPTPGGAFYTVAELPIDDADRFCQWMLEHFEKDGYTVMMAPATGFYANPETGKNQVRIAYVLETNLIIKAIECLKEALPKYDGYTLHNKVSARKATS
ncbi:MAG: aminotransferase [Bacteroidia bacterium]|nr:MAG: aminotransferase [Bacteroidia bacterium]